MQAYSQDDDIRKRMLVRTARAHASAAFEERGGAAVSARDAQRGYEMAEGENRLGFEGPSATT